MQTLIPKNEYVTYTTSFPVRVSNTQEIKINRTSSILPKGPGVVYNALKGSFKVATVNSRNKTLIVNTSNLSKILITMLLLHKKLHKLTQHTQIWHVEVPTLKWVTQAFMQQQLKKNCISCQK